SAFEEARVDTSMMTSGTTEAGHRQLLEREALVEEMAGGIDLCPEVFMDLPPICGDAVSGNRRDRRLLEWKGDAGYGDIRSVFAQRVSQIDHVLKAVDRSCRSPDGQRARTEDRSGRRHFQQWSSHTNVSHEPDSNDYQGLSMRFVRRGAQVSRRRPRSRYSAVPWEDLWPNRLKL